MFKSVRIENLAASLFLIYPIGQIIELLIEWVRIIPFMKIIKGRVNFFLNFDNSNMPKTGYENLETKNLVYTINGRKFSFPDIKIKKDNKLLIEGANGTGKSIFLKILAGELKPQTGEIIFSNPVKEALGYVPQTSLLFNTGIKENITLGNEIPEKEINKMLKTFSLEKPAKRNFVEKDESSFSGGEIKKVDIARSLLNSSGILILDEPTNNLDNKSVEELIKILKTKTLIFTSHDKRLKEIADGTVKINN
ncbi:ATP-binding cassette domain-containing protein [Treponema pedis]|uniref:ATP-binding cassette domain-containing protein n=1 Tax=Treponema pedis TaxID=409322 RepID=UPI003D193EC2